MTYYSTKERAEDLFRTMVEEHHAMTQVVMLAARDEILSIVTALRDVLDRQEGISLDAEFPQRTSEENLIVFLGAVMGINDNARW